MSYKVAGKSINDLMNISPSDFDGLSKQDLRAVTQRLASAANKRVDRMARAGESSPALAKLMIGGGRISTKGKDADMLKVEYFRAKNFLQDKTSSLAGWHKIKRDAAKKAKQRGLLEDDDQPVQKKRRKRVPDQEPEPRRREPEPEPEPEPGPFGGEEPDTRYREEEPEPESEWEPEPFGEEYDIEPDKEEWYGQKMGINHAQSISIWDVIDDLLEEDPRYKDRAFRYHLHEAASELKLSNKKMSYKQIKNNLKKRLEELYKDAQEGKTSTQKSRGGGVSDFFSGD